MTSPAWHAGSPVPRPKDGVAAVEIDGERVLYDPETQVVDRLDRVGAIVWAALDGEGTLSDLAGDVAFAFGVDKREALTGVLRLLEQLDHRGLLDEASGEE